MNRQRRLSPINMRSARSVESIIGSWERYAHSLVSAGINSLTFEILLSVMNCEPFFCFCPGFILGEAQIQCPQNRYTDVKNGLDQGMVASSIQSLVIHIGSIVSSKL